VTSSKTDDAHHTLCLLAEKFLKAQNFGVVFRDGFKAITYNGEQPDAIGFRSNTSCLIEVKVSRADFLRDKLKTFRANPELGVGSWRFYLCPPGIITIDDLPEGWGLLYAVEGKIKKVHGWPPNTRWSTPPFAGRTNKDAEMSMMYSALRRMELQGCLGLIYDGLYGRCGGCSKMLKAGYVEHPRLGRICGIGCAEST
jgi:hypothetical protein